MIHCAGLADKNTNPVHLFVNKLIMKSDKIYTIQYNVLVMNSQLVITVWDDYRHYTGHSIQGMPTICSTHVLLLQKQHFKAIIFGCNTGTKLMILIGLVPSTIFSLSTSK